MKRAWIICFMMCISAVGKANEPLVFKQPLPPKINWIGYISVLLVLVVTAFLIAKKRKPAKSLQSVCQVIEKKYLGNKTVMYVVTYHNQRFLLADNQQALAIYPLSSEQGK